MRTILVFALLFHCFIAYAHDNGRPSGQNCNLPGPPETAGEDINHGIMLRIYPRARDIDINYSGCQSMWAQHEDQWILISMVAIESGDPVRIWSPYVSDPARMGCIYKKGKIVKGDPRNCAAPEFLIMKSLSPGCVAKIRKAVAEGGTGAPRPSGCDHE